MSNQVAAIIQHPQAPAVAFACAVLACSIVVWRWRTRDRGARDPRRMFTAHERAAAFTLAGSQCEYDRWLLWRCTRTAEHGDHFFPWSKGGATSMRNQVAACPRCNLSKGARMPSAWQRARISARRRRYYPAAGDVTVGEWFRGGR